VPIYAKDQSFPIPYYRATPFNILFEHIESVTVDWQNSLTPVLLLFGLTYPYSATTFGAKDMSSPKSCTAHVARKPDAAFEMLNDQCALGKVYVLNLQS